LRQAFEDAELSTLAPAWVLTNRPTQMWALLADLAFPLAAGTSEGEWLATTCLVRGRY
jgi:hypothetical protein